WYKRINVFALAEAIYDMKWIVVDSLEDTVDASDAKTTLREAITNVQDGDSISFSKNLNGGTITLSGTELEITKNITINASALSSGITIDADDKSRIFYISGGSESSPVKLVGLTITGGKSDYGAGVYLENGALLMTNCTVSGNSAIYGGGIYNNNNLSMTNCIISGNVTTSGAGIYNNLTGILTMEGCTVSNNDADSFGGGIYNYSYGTVTLNNCSVADNSATQGSGVYNSGTITLAVSNICGNTASSGAGIFNSSSGSLTLTNCFLYGNIAEEGGGVVNNGSTIMTNCTVVGNSATGISSAGGGMINSSSGSFILYNSIVIFNTSNGSDNDIYRINDNTLSAYNSLSSYSSWDAGSHNLVYDSCLPLFMNAENGDYKLAANSQAIDKGNNTYAVDTEGNPLQYDLLNMPRIYYEIVDLGAYEYQLPNAPTDVHFGIYDPDSRSVEMYWTDNADNEDGFRIEYTINGTTWVLSQFMPENTKYRLCSNMRTDKIYQYRIRTYNVYGSSDWAYGSVSTQTLPNAPDNVRFDNYNPTAKTVEMFWDDNSNNEKGFRIEYSTDNGATWRFSQLKNANETSRTCTGLMANQDYMFRVRAYNDSGYSDWVLGSFSTKIAPNAPSNVSFDTYNPSARTLEMSWNDNSYNEKGFRIEYSMDNGITWKFSQFKTANQTSRTCTGLTVNKDYMFRVRAYNDYGSSDWAVGSFSTKFTPVAPTDLIFSNYDAVTQTVVMSWTDNSNNENGFRIEYSMDNGTTWRVSQFMKADETSRTCTGIKTNTTYMFRVRAYNDAGSSDWVVATFVPEVTSAIQPMRLFDSIFEEEENWI
ncbi:MAG: fibronectin type III domain-containing protein, partial [Planctomycetia bacterium]|nr:fibronectin type III domain-containing protein [Planctomycetia bacterium]